ncbi:MAG: translation initiation factor IF-2 N-terminal domain-containing protein, partial [Acidobacteriaceae bacterium]
MSTVRINELARELEVKSKEILDALTAVGVTEKKTHSSSIETDEAERVRTHILKGRGVSMSAGRHEAEPKPKIDWSQVHRVGDVAKAILEKRQQETHPAPPKAAAAAPPRPAAPAVVAPATPVAARPAA